VLKKKPNPRRSRRRKKRVPAILRRPLPAAEKKKIREESGLGGRFVVGTVGANSARKRYKTIF